MRSHAFTAGYDVRPIARRQRAQQAACNPRAPLHGTIPSRSKVLAFGGEAPPLGGPDVCSFGTQGATSSEFCAGALIYPPNINIS